LASKTFQPFICLLAFSEFATTSLIIIIVPKVVKELNSMSSFLLLFLLSTLAFSLLLVPMPANARIAHWDHGHCASSSSESGEMMSGEGPASHQMENGSSSSGFEDEEESGGEDECASNEDEDAIIVFDCYPPPKGRNLQDLPKSRNITAKPNVRVQVRLHCEGPEANERGSLAADVRLDCGGATHVSIQ
jgi:hypothetical protein